MTTVSQPSVTSTIAPASAVVGNEDQKILIVAQGNGGSIGGGALIESLGLDFTIVDGLVGANSQFAQAYRAVRQVNEISRVDGIVLDDNGSGVDATGNVTFTGTATANGEIIVSVGSELNRSYTVVVADTDTADDVGAVLETLINADTEAPVTASNASGVVTLTAVNAGTLGNDLGIAVSLSLTVPGISNTVTAMTGGAGDPVLTNVFDVIGDTRYQSVIWPYWADTSEVRTLLDGRWNVNNAVRDGVAFTSSVDSEANHISRLGALNSQTLVDFTDATTDEDFFKGPAQLEIPFVKAAYFAGVDALRLTEGASISDFVITANGPLDAFGGPALASKPYFNTPLPLPIIGTGRGWNDTQIENLHNVGGSVLGNNDTKTQAIVGEVVTTYKTDPASNPDQSFKYLNYVRTITAGREYNFRNLKARFAQSRLTEGQVLPGRDMANALVIFNFCVVLFEDLSGVDFVLLEGGEEALNYFKNNLVVTVTKATGQADITSKNPIVTQLRDIDHLFQLSFTTNG